MTWWNNSNEKPWKLRIKSSVHAERKNSEAWNSTFDSRIQSNTDFSTRGSLGTVRTWEWERRCGRRGCCIRNAKYENYGVHNFCVRKINGQALKVHEMYGAWCRHVSGCLERSGDVAKGGNWIALARCHRGAFAVGEQIFWGRVVDHICGTWLALAWDGKSLGDPYTRGALWNT